MGKFDHLDKLQIQAELRKLETVPQKFWGPDVHELRDRLAEILEDEKQAEIARDERKHGETIVAARRSRIASFLSVSAAVVSAGAAVASLYFAYFAHSPNTSAPIAQRNTPTPTPTPQTQSAPTPPPTSTPVPSASTTTTRMPQPKATP